MAWFETETLHQRDHSAMLLNELSCFIPMPQVLSIMMLTKKGQMCSYGSEPVALLSVV